LSKYMMQARFTVQGLPGLQRDGGTGRREAVKKAVESLGGQLESFHFAFGEDDTYTIAELPDKESAAALSMAVSASGALTTKIVVLLTPEEIDTVVRRSVDYAPPSS
jgi:uncharacterized protein with GYD domain